MTSDLDASISRARQLARVGGKGEALSLATALVDRHPHDMGVWLLRAYLYARDGNYVQAVADLTCAIVIKPTEPSLFYDRGRHRLALGEYQSAINDFTKALKICGLSNDEYYSESLHFMRAEALLRLGKKKEALADLAYVREDLRTWTYKLRSKAELLAECYGRRK
jgi:tetratricopeptide (TPR) repeat protein